MLVFAPLVGALIEILVIRNLEGTSEITKLVTPVAVLLALNGIATWVWFRDSSQPHIPSSFFGLDGTKVFGQFVSYHQIVGVVLSIVVAGLLYLLLRKTRLGVTMRATVDDRSLLMLNGGRPSRMSLAAWAIGASLAGLAGVLLSPQLGNLTVFALTLLVFDAYPSALAGRLRSVPRAYAGALAIGLVVSYWAWISEAGTRWIAFKTLGSALPALLLFAVLLLLPQDRLRGTVITRTREHFRVPSLRQSVLWGAIMVLAVGMLQALMENSAVITLANGIALSLIAISLVLTTGYAGEINLAAYSFAGIAAIVAWQFDVGPSGNATQTSMSLAAVVLAVLVCAGVGALIALPALRLRGLYLGLATFAFAVVIDVMVFRQTAPIEVDLLGVDFTINLFTTGTLTMPRPNWFGVDFLASQRNFLMLMTVLFVLIGIGLVALRRSAYGRMVVAMRDSPAACATLGLNITRLKLSVFTLSSAIAGLGGLMWAAQQRNLTNQGTFQVFASLTLFMIAVVGGIGYVSGALLAGMFLSVLSVVMPNVFTKLGADYPTLEWFFVDVLGNFTKFVGAGPRGHRAGQEPERHRQPDHGGLRRAAEGAHRHRRVGGAAGRCLGARLARRHRELDLHDHHPRRGVRHAAHHHGGVARQGGCRPADRRDRGRRPRRPQPAVPGIRPGPLRRRAGPERRRDGELTMALLECRDISISFGGVRALNDVNIVANEGSVTGLIGPNGAGKTTMFNCITGLLEPNSGSLLLDGRELRSLKPFKRARLGIARTFQRLELFTSLSVRDNIRVAGEIRNRWHKGRIDVAAETQKVLDTLRIAHLAERLVSEIPTGMARRVEMGRALMTHPRILLLDEPASGQDEQETVEFGELLIELAAQPAPASSSSNTTSPSSCGCAPTSRCSISGASSPAGHPRTSAATPQVIAAYLGEEKDGQVEHEPRTRTPARTGGRPRRLRPDRGPARRRSHGASRRGPRPARTQRCREVDQPQGRRRPHRHQRVVTYRMAGPLDRRSERGSVSPEWACAPCPRASGVFPNLTVRENLMIATSHRRQVLRDRGPSPSSSSLGSPSDATSSPAPCRVVSSRCSPCHVRSPPTRRSSSSTNCRWVWRRWS